MNPNTAILIIKELALERRASEKLFSEARKSAVKVRAKKPDTELQFSTSVWTLREIRLR